MSPPTELPLKEKELARTLVTQLEQTGGDATKIRDAKAHLSNELNGYGYEERDKIAHVMEAMYLGDKSLNKNLPEVDFSFGAPPNKGSLVEVFFSVKAGSPPTNTGGPEHLYDISVREKGGLGFLQDAYDMPGEANQWRLQYKTGMNRAAMAAALEADTQDTVKRFGTH